MSISRVSITCSIGRRCTSTSNIDCWIVSGFSPCDIVRLPCGSRSISSTLKPCSANATPRFSVVVVFATPPFWFASTITCVSAGAGTPAGRTLGRGRRRARPIYERHFCSAYRIPSASSRSFVDGDAGARVALGARPRLGLGDERPQLVEEHARLWACPKLCARSELLDPPQPCQHPVRLVHRTDASERGVTCLCRLSAECVTGATRSGRNSGHAQDGGRPRPQTEQRLVERGDERRRGRRAGVSRRAPAALRRARRGRAARCAATRARSTRSAGLSPSSTDGAHRCGPRAPRRRRTGR